MRVRRRILWLAVLVLAGAAVWTLRSDGYVRAAARRAWKDRAIATVSGRAADPGWVNAEIAHLKAITNQDALASEHWLTPGLMLMSNGDWLAYASTGCKVDWRIDDIFLARGSDGRWYYSTYHFCKGMVSVIDDDQAADLGQFSSNYFLRTFDGKSDECLKKTWPPSAAKVERGRPK